jgi:hypothetical protein
MTMCPVKTYPLGAIWDGETVQFVMPVQGQEQLWTVALDTR